MLIELTVRSDSVPDKARVTGRLHLNPFPLMTLVRIQPINTESPTVASNKRIYNPTSADTDVNGNLLGSMDGTMGCVT